MRKKNSEVDAETLERRRGQVQLAKAHPNAFLLCPPVSHETKDMGCACGFGLPHHLFELGLDSHTCLCGRSVTQAEWVELWGGQDETT